MLKKQQTELRDFGQRSGLKVYPVSIGAMRLPADEQEAIALMRMAMDAGMVYIDTSRGYADSEIKVGKSLKDGYRDKAILSTKWSPWNLKVQDDDDTSADCTYKRIIESMERLGVEYLDFYQIWSINNSEHYAQATKSGGMLDGIRRAVDEGLVGHIGFTTHDTPENISRYLDEADWCEAILCTHNIMDQTYSPVLAKAHRKGIATIVMNPIAGGMLAEDSSLLSRAVRETLGGDDVVEAGHRYLHGNSDVDTILCGISKKSDVASTLANYRKPALTQEQRKAIEQAMAGLSSGQQGFCTGCGYCLPCPQGINIPAMMQVVYHDKILQVPRRAGALYRWAINPASGEPSGPPADCARCGECEKRCTRHLKITEEMEYLARKYGKH